MHLVAYGIILLGLMQCSPLLSMLSKATRYSTTLISQESVVSEGAQANPREIAVLEIENVDDPHSREALSNLLARCAKAETSVACLLPYDKTRRLQENESTFHFWATAPAQAKEDLKNFRCTPILIKAIKASLPELARVPVTGFASSMDTWSTTFCPDTDNENATEYFLWLLRTNKAAHENKKLSFLTRENLPAKVWPFSVQEMISTSADSYAKAVASYQEKEAVARKVKKPSEVSSQSLPPTLRELEILLTKNSTFRERFFSSAGEFEMLLKQWPQQKHENMTVSQLIQECRRLAKAAVEQAARLPQDSVLKPLIIKNVEKINALAEQMPAVCREYGVHEWDSCFTFKMALVKKQCNFLFIEEKQPVFHALMKRIAKLTALLHIITATSDAHNLLIVLPEHSARIYHRLLSHVCQHKKEAILTKNRTAQLSSLFVEPVISAVQDKTERDSSLCDICLQEKESFCEKTCDILRPFFEKNPLLNRLGSEQPLSRDDYRVAARASMFLEWFCLLLENYVGSTEHAMEAIFKITTDRSSFYTLSHQPVIDEFKRILALSQSPAPQSDGALWRQALDFVGQFGIDCRKIVILLNLALYLKNEHLRLLLEKTKKQSYKSLQEAELVNFDPDNKLYNALCGIMMPIASHLGLEHELKKVAEPGIMLPTALHGFFVVLISRLNRSAMLAELHTKDLVASQEGNGIRGDSVFLYPYRRQYDASAESPETVNNDSGPSEVKADAAPQVRKKRRPKKQDSLANSFVEVIKKKRSPALTECKEFNAYFHNTTFYTVKLFNAKSHFNAAQMDVEARKAWKTNPSFTYATRLKLLFALYYQDRHNGIHTLPEHGLLLRMPEEIAAKIDPSIASKLDLHHLFTEKLDTLLSSYGIIESKALAESRGIQITIPGEIRLSSGAPSVGFFQYTFRPSGSDFICIHRCFRSYNSNLAHTHISISLRRALYDYLLHHYGNDDTYRGIVQELKEILQLPA